MTIQPASIIQSQDTSQDGPIRGILFDKDGTLIDFCATWIPAYTAAAEELAIAVGDAELTERLLRAGGFDPDTQTFCPSSVLSWASISEISLLWSKDPALESVDDVCHRVGRCLDEHAIQTLVAVTDLDVLFTRLRKRGIRIGVATTDSTASAQAMLERFAVEEHVDFVAGYDKGFGTKPEPGMVHGFCEITGLQPREVAVVGDTRKDLEMARRASAGLSVGVLSGICTREHLDDLADCIIESVDEIEKVIGV